MKTDLLFVYGSLMGGIQSPIATYLKSKSTFLGEGHVFGKLYDIGKYPGLINDARVKSKVIGHVFQFVRSDYIYAKCDTPSTLLASEFEDNGYQVQNLKIIGLNDKRLVSNVTTK